MKFPIYKEKVIIHDNKSNEDYINPKIVQALALITMCFAQFLQIVGFITILKKIFSKGK